MPGEFTDTAKAFYYAVVIGIPAIVILLIFIACSGGRKARDE